MAEWTRSEPWRQGSIIELADLRQLIHLSTPIHQLAYGAWLVLFGDCSQ